MRIIAITAALAALTMPAAANDAWLLQDGVYCPAHQEDVFAIVVGPGNGLGIDGLDCSDVRLTRGRARSASCWANGGYRVDLDVDLLVLPSGALLHDSVLYRRWTGPLPCPRS